MSGRELTRVVGGLRQAVGGKKGLAWEVGAAKSSLEIRAKLHFAAVFCS